MQVELKPHMAITNTGEEVEIGQWMVFADGQHVGYLPHAVDSEILPIIGFPWDHENEIAEKCKGLRKKIDGQDSEVFAPQHHLKIVEDALKAQALEEKESEDDDDDDNEFGKLE
jgi:hypothetical protein